VSKKDLFRVRGSRLFALYAYRIESDGILNEMSAKDIETDDYLIETDGYWIEGGFKLV